MKPYYSDDAVTLYHGDCRDVLPLLPMADFLFTDPPYDIVAAGGGIGAKREYLANIVGFTDGGFDVALLRPFPNWAVFCAKKQLPALLNEVGDRRWMLVTWNKPNPTPLVNANYLPDTEYIVHAWRTQLYGSYADRARFVVYPTGGGTTGHPNEKPLRVIEKMVRCGSDVGQLVVDPFAGSGTTLVASKNLGRRAVGIEIDEKHCETAAQRLSQSVLNFGGAA